MIEDTILWIHDYITVAIKIISHEILEQEIN